MQKVLRELIFWTWCLPQTLLGLILLVFFKATKQVVATRDYKNIKLVKIKNSKIMGGISLGRWNFVTERRWNDGSRTIEHEYGHTRQGFILGPLYLVLVGIPSEFWLVCSHFSPHIKATYHTRYPENWADKLGGIKKK